MNPRTDFEVCFGHPAEGSAFATGRVNLLGEHTDYNGGFVLPMGIPQRTQVQFRRLESPEVRVASAQKSAVLESYTLSHERLRAEWLDYVQGVTRMLIADGHALGGAELFISSDVPLGAGLSSSAALTVSVCRAFRRAYQLELDDQELALLAYRAEHDFVGVPIGVMDPMAVCLADVRAPIFLDTQSLSWERVSLPASCEVLVIDSGVGHEHASGGYLTRRKECDLAAQLLHATSLREVQDGRDLEALPETLRRRARHVISENERVLQAVAALRSDDVATVGRLFDESHASMRDDFEVSVPAVDLLVRVTRMQPGCWGARLTGGGFGGAIVALVERGTARKVGEAALAAYAAHGGEGTQEGRLLIVGAAP
jgi:galactokinase